MRALEDDEVVVLGGKVVLVLVVGGEVVGYSSCFSRKVRLSELSVSKGCSQRYAYLFTSRIGCDVKTGCLLLGTILISAVVVVHTIASR